MRPKHMTNKQLADALRPVIGELRFVVSDLTPIVAVVEEAIARLNDDDLRKHYSAPREHEQPILDTAGAIKEGLENVVVALRDIANILNETLIEKRKG